MHIRTFLHTVMDNKYFNTFQSPRGKKNSYWIQLRSTTSRVSNGLFHIKRYTCTLKIHTLLQKD